jgi:hypothetical protein
MYLRYTSVSDGVTISVHNAVCLAKLFVKATLLLVRKRERRFTKNSGGWFESHIFAFKIAVECIQEKAIMRD